MRGSFDRIFLDVGHDHIGARLGKRRRDSEADAGSGTRDDRGLPEMSFIARRFARVGDLQPTAARKMRR
jgi:hypothetical protein